MALTRFGAAAFHVEHIARMQDIEVRDNATSHVIVWTIDGAKTILYGADADAVRAFVKMLPEPSAPGSAAPQ